MSDWLVIRIPFDKPSHPEVIEILPDIPLNWGKYLSQVAKRTKKSGRYLAANILYNAGEAFYPREAKKDYYKAEKEFGD